MTQLYVLMKSAWGYNDEVQFSTDGGHPKKVFTSEEKAKEECERLNFEHFKRLFETGEIKDYSYNLEDNISYSLRKDKKEFAKLKLEISKVSEKIFRLPFEELTEVLWEGSPDIENAATDEDWKQFLSYFDLVFWEVVTVEKAD
jgi:hypothetical protein